MALRQYDDHERDVDEPISILEVIKQPWYSLTNFIGELKDNDPSLSSDQPMLALTIRWITLPFRLFVGFLLFIVQAWASTRSGFAFLRAVPAILAMSTFFLAWLIADFVNNESRMIGANQGYYRYNSKTYPEHPEYATAFAEKLVKIKPDDAAFKYQLGLAKVSENNEEAAVNVMSSIAPEDSSGHDMAHIWLARYYLRAQFLGLDEDGRNELVQKHLGFAVQADRENRIANKQLAEIYVKKSDKFARGTPEYLENREKAIAYYESFVDGEIRDVFQVLAIPNLIELQLDVGNTKLAQERSRGAINQLRPIVERQPEVVGVWYAMIRCALILKQYQRAEDIAKEGISLVKQEKSKLAMYEFASLIGEQMGDDFVNMNDERQYAIRLQALCNAVTYNPFKRDLYNKLLEFVVAEARTRNEGEINNDVEVIWPAEINELWLRNGVIGSKTSGVVHGLIGMLEIAKGNIAEGETHWKLAQGQLPGAERIIDMLIRVAVEQKEIEVTNSFEMINLAIELFPEVPSFYHTRGIYYEKQGRFQDAIKDFNHVAEKLPKDVVLHKFLIRCYEQLNDQENVINQKIMLERKLAEMDKGDRKRTEKTLKRFERR